MSYRVLPEFTLEANGIQTFTVMAQTVRVLECTGLVLVGFDDDDMQELSVGIGPRQPKPFMRLRVQDASGASNTVKIAVSMGDITDTRFSLDSGAVVPVSLTRSSAGSATAVTVGVAAASLVSANTSRKSLTITNLGTQSIYLGFSGAVTVATGFPVAAGGSIEISDTTAELFAIGDAADLDVRLLEV